MSEDKLNENRIRDKIRGICQDSILLDKIVPIINKMLKETYINGLKQGKFDKEMEKQQCYDEEEHQRLIKENEELKNILTELEKWLKEKTDKKTYSLYDYNLKQGQKQCLDKLQELKERKE